MTSGPPWSTFALGLSRGGNDHGHGLAIRIEGELHQDLRASSKLIPAFIATTSKAPSVGSPITCQVLFSWEGGVSFELLQIAAVVNNLIKSDHLVEPRP